MNILLEAAVNFTAFLAQADEGSKGLSLDWSALFSTENLLNFVRAVALGIIGMWFFRLIGKMLENRLRPRMSPQHLMLLTKTIVYGGTFLIVMGVLSQLGFKMASLLGAAGILGVAIGFASQTSMSNLISGIFLIFERPFQIGDLVTIGSITGVIHSVDLLSVKIRQFDNKFIRVPNESVIKENVINITYFPIRRIDINVGIAYKESLERAREVLLEIAEDHPKALSEPEPVVLFTGFGSSSLDILFGVWVQKRDFLWVRNDLTVEIKKRFDEAGIEIPFPHVTVYAGEASIPMPIHLRPGANGSTQEGEADPSQIDLLDQRP